MEELQPDPIREVRVARRWAFAGIVWGALALMPLYSLALGLSFFEAAYVLTPAAAAAFVSVELAARWESRMRRRYAYPHRLAYELASIYDFPDACRRSAELLGRWLHVDGVVVAWVTDDGGSVAPVATFGLPEGWLDDAPSVPASTYTEDSEGSRGCAERRARGDAWFGASYPGGIAVYVPLISRDRVEGVLALAAGRRNPQARDRRLLSALGTMMGLALDNCRLYEGQRKQAQHLQQLNRMKSDFLSTVSHELRTPLTSIMLAAEMLHEEEENEDPASPRVRLVSNIVKGASRLSHLVADLVDVSRHDDFQPRLELDSTPLADIITSAASIIQPLLAAKHQTLDIHMENPEATILADRLRFEQVLINLLSNAQRYSPERGHMTVTTKLENGETVIRVKDSGPGVPPQDRDLIFEPFHRGDRSGLGLGLAIAKSLVELHNGRIWVESKNGLGSTFCVAVSAHSPTVTRTREPAQVSG